MNELKPKDRIYFDTTHLDKDELEKAVTTAADQNLKVFYAFVYSGQKEHTPFSLYQFLIDKGKLNPNTPVTSIRRSMTVLTKKYHVLYKTGNQVLERLGRPNYTWALTEKQLSLF